MVYSCLVKNQDNFWNKSTGQCSMSVWHIHAISLWRYNTCSFQHFVDRSKAAIAASIGTVRGIHPFTGLRRIANSVGSIGNSLFVIPPP